VFSSNKEIEKYKQREFPQWAYASFQANKPR